MLNALQDGSSSALSATRRTFWADLLNTRLGRRKAYQTKVRMLRKKQKVCQTAYRHVPGEVPGRSDSLTVNYYCFLSHTANFGKRE